VDNAGVPLLLLAMNAVRQHRPTHAAGQGQTADEAGTGAEVQMHTVQRLPCRSATHNSRQQQQQQQQLQGC